MKTTYSEVLRSSTGVICPRRTVIAPNRLETRNWDLLASIIQMRSPHTLIQLRDALRTLTGRQLIFFAPSCRAAIAQVLSLLPQHEVVLPAYTCPVVKTAIRVAGKRIIYVDIAKNSLNSTSAEFAEEAKPGRVLIPTHIFGFPTDIKAITDLSRAQDCVTIEDAAAGFGARLDGRILGTYGDIGVISFERSKRLPAFRGAAIIINNEKILDPVKLSATRLIETRQVMPLHELAFALFYNAVTPSWFYGRVTLPLILRKYRRSKTLLIQKDLGAEKESPFYTRDFHDYQAALILRLLKRFDNIRTRIAGLVSVYRHTLAGTSIMTFDPPNCDDAGLLRFPVVFPDRERTELLHSSLNRGLFLETNYERPLPEEEELAKFPNAVWAARNLILLPLYARLSSGDAEWIAKEIMRI
jgi:dTDP-4-amino-4,6-dideoxygalactose transaminase